MLQVANLKESTWNFFERLFYTQKNVLNTERGISDDITEIWNMKMSTFYTNTRQINKFQKKNLLKT